MKRSPILHPFLFAIYPVLSVLAASLSLLDPAQVVRPLIISLVIPGLILALLYWIYKDWYRAGFLTSILIWMLFYYGYSYRIPQVISVFGVSISRHIIILCFWIVLFAFLSSGWLWKRIRPQVINNLLNISSGLALLYAIFLIASFVYSSGKDPLANWSRPVNPSEDNIHLSASYRPDIYYIILDGYARSDVLQTIYAYDNSAFISSLEERGFYIADQSHSNYGETQLSLASSMNFEYLDYLSFASGISTNRAPLGKMILDSRLRTWLEQAGYKVYLSGEYLFAEVNDPAVVFITHQAARLNTFESLLLESTMFEALVEEADINVSNYTYQTHREKILNGFAEVKSLINTRGPKFVFVHIIAPHPPFVFDSNGKAVQPNWEYTIFDATQFAGGTQDYENGYREQLTYINGLVIDMIDQLLNKSSTPPIIILQADHGPAALMGSSLESSCLEERFSILNAIYLPDHKNGVFYPTITPVNTFRELFNSYFGTNLDLLPDKVYYTFGDRYHFIDITQQVDTPCDIPGQP